MGKRIGGSKGEKIEMGWVSMEKFDYRKKVLYIVGSVNRVGNRRKWCMRIV